MDDTETSQLSKLLHDGQEAEQWKHGAVVPPIVCSTTFKQVAPGEGQYDYSRSGNPTRQCLETSLATLEHAKYGLAFASGLGATTAIMFLLKSGDHVIAGNDLYGGTFRLMDKCAKKCMGLEIDFIDYRKTDVVASYIKPNTRLIWVETPTNPMMSIIDIEAISKLKSENDNLIIVVDNTFATPVFQNPLKLGADLVVHSLTKYINGHSDVIMGSIMTNSQNLLL